MTAGSRVSRDLQSTELLNCLHVTPVKKSCSHMQLPHHSFASTSITVPMSLLRRRHGSWRLLPNARLPLERKLTLSLHARHFQESLGHAISTGEPIAVLQAVYLSHLNKMLHLSHIFAPFKLYPDFRTHLSLSVVYAPASHP